MPTALPKVAQGVVNCELESDQSDVVPVSDCVSSSLKAACAFLNPEHFFAASQCNIHVPNVRATESEAAGEEEENYVAIPPLPEIHGFTGTDFVSGKMPPKFWWVDRHVHSLEWDHMRGQRVRLRLGTDCTGAHAPGVMLQALADALHRWFEVILHVDHEMGSEANTPYGKQVASFLQKSGDAPRRLYKDMSVRVLGGRDGGPCFFNSSLKPIPLPETLDLYIASTSCQQKSLRNRKRDPVLASENQTTESAETLHAAVATICLLRPRSFILENVGGCPASKVLFFLQSELNETPGQRPYILVALIFNSLDCDSFESRPREWFVGQDVGYVRCDERLAQANKWEPLVRAMMLDPSTPRSVSPDQFLMSRTCPLLLPVFQHAQMLASARAAHGLNGNEVLRERHRVHKTSWHTQQQAVRCAFQAEGVTVPWAKVAAPAEALSIAGSWEDLLPTSMRNFLPLLRAGATSLGGEPRELWWDLSDCIDHQRPLRAQQERTIACLVKQHLQWSDSIHRWAHGAEHLLWHGFPPSAWWSTAPDKFLRALAGNSMSCPAGSIPLTLLLWSMDWGAGEPQREVCTPAPPPMIIKVPRGRLVAGAELPGLCKARASTKRKRESMH